MAIAIVDYRKGNLRSVASGFEEAGYQAIITEDPEQIAAAEAIVLPGVGAFADASAMMQQLGQMQVIRERVLDDGVPFLGICLGMQLMLERGNEGADGWVDGLGIIAGSCERIPDTTADGVKVKVPHVGWNTARFTDVPCPLFDGIAGESYFYFTHSYAAMPDDESCVIARTTHARPFVSGIMRGNAFGVQFHPEKSSTIGLKVLENFGKLAWDEPKWD